MAECTAPCAPPIYSGVTKAEVSFEKSTARITYDPAKIDRDGLVDAVREIGYTVTE